MSNIFDASSTSQEAELKNKIRDWNDIQKPSLYIGSAIDLAGMTMLGSKYYGAKYSINKLTEEAQKVPLGEAIYHICDGICQGLESDMKTTGWIGVLSGSMLLGTSFYAKNQRDKLEDKINSLNPSTKITPTNDLKISHLQTTHQTTEKHL